MVGQVMRRDSQANFLKAETRALRGCGAGEGQRSERSQVTKHLVILLILPFRNTAKLKP
ncbi:hypothetical protein OCEANICA350_11427 [Oceanicaulis sp. 350]|nr:hypothetical protein OCEANICA350_11427 [Oceanicaulis sp. 350]